MGIKIVFCLISLSVVISLISTNDSSERRPVPSILDEILRANGSEGIDANDQINALLDLFPSGSSDSGSSGGSSGGGGDDSTGFGVLDFFRNIIAMFLRTFLQVFRVFQLLARTITGTDTKKLEFLSKDQTISDISDKQSTDKTLPKVENVLQLIRRSAEEYPMEFLVSDHKIQDMENRIKDALKSSPNVDNKSLDEILKSDFLSDKWLTDLKTFGRRERQIGDNGEDIGHDLESLLNEFFSSQLNNDFEFELTRNKN